MVLVARLHTDPTNHQESLEKIWETSKFPPNPPSPANVANTHHQSKVPVSLYPLDLGNDFTGPCSSGSPLQLPLSCTSALPALPAELNETPTQPTISGSNSALETFLQPQSPSIPWYPKFTGFSYSGHSSHYWESLWDWYVL
jgi:hypothetical protein